MKADIDLEGLEEHEIESWQQSEISKIYPLLRGGLFHRTSIEGYRGIRSSGQIFPNRGQFPFTYPQSKHYLAFSKGYVSLFDFGSIRDQDCISIHHTWGQFFFDQKPITIILRLNRDSLSQLIPNNSAPKRSAPDYRSYIPYVEAWYPEAIPVEAIDSFIVVMYRGPYKDPLFKEFTREEIDQFEELINEIEWAWRDVM
jgi:hypothetical protein